MMYELSISQRLLLDAAITKMTELPMSQKDKDEYEKLQMMLCLNLPGGKYGIKKIKEVLV